MKPEREPRPNVVKFVSMKVNPKDHRKLMNIHYDPEATAGARSEALHTAAGEKVLPALLKAFAA